MQIFSVSAQVQMLSKVEFVLTQNLKSEPVTKSKAFEKVFYHKIWTTYLQKHQILVLFHSKKFINSVTKIINVKKEIFLHFISRYFWIVSFKIS